MEGPDKGGGSRDGETMCAVLLTGHGDFDKLEFREDVARPVAGPGQVLIRVRAAGVNNTDVNTRLGWYSKTITTSEDGEGGDAPDENGGWAGALQFPRIQGIDCCGHIEAVGDGVPPERVGERVLVKPMVPVEGEPYMLSALGSEQDGAFAEFLVVEAQIAVCVNAPTWTDVELASIPCSYSTAENMLERARVTADDRVLITGASGGVGSAAVQLAKRRGAYVLAVASQSKADVLRDELHADEVLLREQDWLAELGSDAVDVVIDVVGGDSFGSYLDHTLKRGGRLAISGAIAGPVTEIDLRSLYLRDLQLFGCTWQPDKVFQNLVSYVESDAIKPLVARTFPLRDIVAAQKLFLSKRFVGKLVLEVGSGAT